MSPAATRLAALAPDGYQVPTAEISRKRLILLMSISLATLFGWLAYRAAQDTGAILGHDHEALLWSMLMLVASHQTLLAWFDKPYTVTGEQQAGLDLLPVHVSVPLYNESPEIVDRVMYALSIQTKRPYRIVVVDDGTTKFDYGALRTFWVARFAELGVLCEWARQANAGKRHAQAVAFRTARDGIMVTLDSDTALERTALEEIVKPFANPEVWSVAGLELAYNQTRNLLTRINGMRQLSWQMVQCAALNRFGAILVNRGTFAAYRAELVRETVDAYVSEMFMGKPVKYSDDSLLTLYALGRGKAVQQVSAHQYSEYAETLSHALRQWTRWMRGATIRSVWRAKYLRPLSYAGVINYLNWWQLAASSAAYVYVGVVLPYEGRASLSAISAAVGASYLANVRTLLVKRDDQNGLGQLDTWLLSPLAWAWSLLVLRPIRAYAILTCGNNGWGTRSRIEVGELAGVEAAGLMEPTDTQILVPARLPEQTAAFDVAATYALETVPPHAVLDPSTSTDTAVLGSVLPAGGMGGPPPRPDRPTELIPAARRSGRGARRRPPLWARPWFVTMTALGVGACATVVIAVGFTSSIHANIQYPPPAAPRVAAKPAVVPTLSIPTDGATIAAPGGVTGPGAPPLGVASLTPSPTPPHATGSAPAVVIAAPTGTTPAASAGSSSPAPPSPSASASVPASSPSGTASGPASPTATASASAAPSASGSPQ